jgi:hypothetical protein
MNKLVINPLRWVSLIFCDKNTSQPLQPINDIFSRLPELVYDIHMFTNGIKAKIGLLILYNEMHNNYFEALIAGIKRNEFILEIIVR